MTNPYADAVDKAFGGIAPFLEERNQNIRLQGLMQAAGAGNTDALAALADLSPKAAETIQAKIATDQAAQEQEDKKRLFRVANLSQTARSLEDPVKIRAYLQNELRQEGDQEIREEIEDALSLDDERLMFDLDSAIATAKANLGEFIEPISSTAMTPFQQRSLDLQERSLELQEERLKKGENTPALIEFDHYQELKKTDPEAAAEFGKERGYIDSEGRELSVFMQKRLSDANDTAILSRAKQAEMLDLAARFEASGITGGTFSRWKDKLADFTGSREEAQKLRTLFFKYKGSEVINSLPPGAASDPDIAMFSKGYPPDNAEATEIASFFRGMAKAAAFDDEYNTFKAYYISDKRNEAGMLEAWRKEVKEIAPDIIERSNNSMPSLSVEPPPRQTTRKQRRAEADAARREKELEQELGL